MATADKIPNNAQIKAVYDNLNGKCSDLLSAADNSNVLPVSYRGYLDKGKINPETNKWVGMGNNSFRYAILPVTAGAAISIKANSNLSVDFAALQSYTATPEDGDTPVFSAATGWTTRTMTAKAIFTGTIPSDATVLYFFLGDSLLARLPESILIDGYDYAKNLHDNIAGIASDLESASGIYDSLTNDGQYTIKVGDLESGLWAYSAKTDSATRGRTKNLIPVRAGMTIDYQNVRAGDRQFDVFFGVLETPTSGAYGQVIGWQTGASGTISITMDGYMTFVIRDHFNTSADIDVADYNSTVTIKTKMLADVASVDIEALTAYAVDTAGPADVVTVTDGADGVRMKQVKAAITPVQDLHGYDNPWPGGVGKNLFNPALFVNRTASGVTSEVQADGTIHLFGTSSGSVRYNSSAGNIVLPAGTYTITGSPNTARMRHDSTIIDTDGVFTSDGTTELLITVAVDSGTAIDIYEKIQIEAGSTATSWEPYSNFCPISGHDSVTVTRVGKNLITWPYPGFYGAKTRSIANGSVICTSNDDGSISFSGTASTESWLYLSEYSASYDNGFKLWPGDFLLTCDGMSGGTSGGGGYRIQCSVYNNGTLRIARDVYSAGGEAQMTLIDGDLVDMYVYVPAGKNMTGIILKPMVRPASVTDSTFEKYTSMTIPVNLSTLTGGTVYGGTLTVNDDGTGTVVVDTGYVVLTGDSSENWQFVSYTSWPSYGHAYQLNINGVLGSEGGGSVLSNMYEAKSTYWAENYSAIYPQFNNYIVVADPAFTTIESFKAFLSNNNLQVAYKISTPTTYTLTSDRLTTLLGTNNVWADAGQVTIDYRADTALYIDKKLAELQALILENINS